MKLLNSNQNFETMKKGYNWMILIAGLSACTESGQDPGNGGPGGSSGGQDWLVPVGQVFDGGPGKDGIPALEDPEMVSANAIERRAVGRVDRCGAARPGGDRIHQLVQRYRLHVRSPDPIIFRNSLSIC